jgi:hypothetical protein
MHSDFSGDNKDHGKGFVLASVFEAIRDWNIRVDPMLSDGIWPAANDDRALAYRRFLRLPLHCPLVNSDIQYRGLNRIGRNGRREDYFQPHTAHDYDLFFDPNTGIRRGGGSDYLPMAALLNLLPLKSQRVILCFQSRWQRTCKRLFEERYRQQLTDIGMECFLCFLGQDTYMAFISQNGNNRLRNMKAIMREAFHPFDGQRINPD